MCPVPLLPSACIPCLVNCILLHTLHAFCTLCHIPLFCGTLRTRVWGLLYPHCNFVVHGAMLCSCLPPCACTPVPYAPYLPGSCPHAFYLHGSPFTAQHPIITTNIDLIVFIIFFYIYSVGLLWTFYHAFPSPPSIAPANLLLPLLPCLQVTLCILSFLPCYCITLPVVTHNLGSYCNSCGLC